MTDTEARWQIDEINAQLKDAIGNADRFCELVNRRNMLMMVLKQSESPISKAEPIMYVNLTEKIRNFTRGI